MAIVVRDLGRVDYVSTVDAMRCFTAARTESTPDEIWMCEHPSVYTQGVAGRDEHVRSAGDIPVVRTDRGGQVTYHGPGQVVAYPLIDLQRCGLRVKEYVFRLEEALLKTLRVFGVTGHRVSGAPGVYVRLDDPYGHALLARSVDAEGEAAAFSGLGKIAAIGVKIARRGSYHGASLNVDMDLAPFDAIDACGYRGLRTIALSTIGVAATRVDVSRVLAAKLVAYLDR